MFSSVIVDPVIDLISVCSLFVSFGDFDFGCKNQTLGKLTVRRAAAKNAIGKKRDVR